MTTNISALAATYEAALLHYIHDEQAFRARHHQGREDTNLTAATAALLTALHNTESYPDQAAVNDFAAAATAFVLRVDQELDPNRDPISAASNRSLARLTLPGALHDVLGPLHRATSQYTDSGQLTEAQALVTRLRGELTAATLAVETAVTDGDIDALLALRRAAELDLPGDLAEAEADLLELAAQRAEARALPGRAQDEAAQDAAADAGRRVKQLEEELSAARRALELAHERASLLNRAAAPAEVEADTQRSQADTARTALQAGHEARVRRLVGLSQ